MVMTSPQSLLVTRLLDVNLLAKYVFVFFLNFKLGSFFFYSTALSVCFILSRFTESNNNGFIILLKYAMQMTFHLSTASNILLNFMLFRFTAYFQCNC